MRSRTYLLIVPLLSLLCLSFIVRSPFIERIYAKVESRQVQRGKLITTRSEVCYDRNGDMVTHFISPTDYVIVSNKHGEVKMYDPAKNTVISQQNNSYSTQTSQFYYFLSGKSTDMGLTDFGFIPTETYPERNYIVSIWKLKVPDPQVAVQEIKLVHQNQNPIYIDYKDGKGFILRKVFYYGYIQLNHLSFPSTATEIIYNTTTKDSTIVKTVYSDFKLNNEAKSPYFGYKIPANAKSFN